MTIVDPDVRCRIKSRTTLEIEPPEVANLVHVLRQSAENPYPVSINVGRVVESTYETPGAGPSEGLEIEIADIVEHVVVVTSYASNDE